MPNVAGVKLKDFTSGPELVAVPAPGVGGFYPLAATAEPLSAGALPVRPSLVASLTAGWRVNTALARAGYVRTCGVDTKPRPRFRVFWMSAPRTSRDSLVTFFRSIANRKLGFDLEIDGQGGGTIKARALGNPRYTWTGKPAHDIEIDCEEIF